MLRRCAPRGAAAGEGKEDAGMESGAVGRAGGGAMKGKVGVTGGVSTVMGGSAWDGD